MRIVALAGGVGGAKLAHGLALLLPARDLTVIVNTGDDFEHLGLHISPDLDTVCYTLAGLANRKLGWGLADDSWNALGALQQLGGPTWFQLGDRDLATHLERTRRLRNGTALSQVTQEFCRAWGVKHTILPMTNARVATVLQTDEGDLDFQDYFVRLRCQPHVHGFLFKGVEQAAPAPGVTEVLSSADGIIICPSNPWVSIEPILSVPGIRALVASGKSIAVSPIVGGRALKGPADKMFREMGVEPSALAVASQYQKVIHGFVLDRSDAELELPIQDLGLKVRVTNTIMSNLQHRRQLARDVLDFL
jgi:LPPG:FO 2-phospho-L-lactate transferase